MDAELKKYLTGHLLWLKILSLVVLGLFFVPVIRVIAGAYDAWPGILILFFGFVATLIPQLIARKFLNDLQTSENFPQIVADFEKAYAMRNDTIRFGTRWVFTKGKKRILTYTDITQVYQHIHKTNFIEDERSLKYINKNGKNGTLCKLELGGASDEELKQMLGIIYSKNPSIKIGYF